MLFILIQVLELNQVQKDQKQPPSLWLGFPLVSQGKVRMRAGGKGSNGLGFVVKSGCSQRACVGLPEPLCSQSTMALQKAQRKRGYMESTWKRSILEVKDLGIYLEGNSRKKKWKWGKLDMEGEDLIKCIPMNELSSWATRVDDLGTF
jgi:hypothetical protein